MNIIFMGTPDFSVPCLEKLYNEGHNISLVVTQPDKPFGRGKKIKKSEVKIKAEELGLEVFQPIKVKQSESVDKLRTYNPDLIVVVAYGQILSKDILEMPKYGCINVHASLLPKLRGAAPINWSIINGDLITGITTMQMDIGLDTGDMLLEKSVEITPDMTAQDLRYELMNVGADLLIETINKLQRNELVPVKQDDSLSTYAPMLNKELALIKWNDTALNIYNKIRGLYPDQIAYFIYEGNNVKIHKAAYEKESTNFEPGTVIDVSNNGIKVATNDGAIIIEELQMPGKKKMMVSDFLRGNKFPEQIKL